MQELICYVGQLVPFDEGSEVLMRLSGISVTDKQIERISHFYGEKLEELEKEEEPSYECKADLHYAMVDGSMIFTRESGWREVKLGRIFSAEDIQECKKRTEVRKSTYAAHIGDCKSFFEKFDKKLDGHRNLVIIADGATWIWDHFSAHYPEAPQILDFFHAVEKVAGFAKAHFTQEILSKEWLEMAKGLLHDGRIEQLCDEISAFSCKGNAAVVQSQTLNYLINNINRMRYDQYREKGYLIGSGAMESAHRHVIQQRLKLSGQRWTLAGAQQVLNIRVAYKNGQQNRLLRLIARKIAA